MKELFGSPGKKSGLILRIGQCFFAAASIGIMASASGFSATTAFWSSKGFLPNESRGAHVIGVWLYLTCSMPNLTACAVVFGYHAEKAHILGYFCAFYWKLRTYRYLIASMGLQVLWSFGLACLDIHALRFNKDLHNHIIVSLFVVGDWVTATLSLAAACSSAGVMVLFTRDTNICQIETKFSCDMFQISIAFAFASWVLLAISSYVMFWLVATI